MGISSQNTLLNNFPPVQPILTCIAPIDSAQVAETHGNIKIFPNFILGEQLEIYEKIPFLKNFSTV
jgi:hypothetical protein